MNIPTYPAYPLNGGPLKEARSGQWAVEPKLNGWRALVHVPSGSMFNHDLHPLSIQEEFEPALAALKDTPFEWLDCEALSRRHALGRGTLVVLDAVLTPASYQQRRQLLEEFLALYGLTPELSGAVLVPSFPAERASELWDRLQRLNQQWGAEFFEGLVCKRLDSFYPFQLQTSKKPFPYWVKHRWQF